MAKFLNWAHPCSTETTSGTAAVLPFVLVLAILGGGCKKIKLNLKLFKRTLQYLQNLAKLCLARQSRLEQKQQTALEFIMAKAKD